MILSFSLISGALIIAILLIWRDFNRGSYEVMQKNITEDPTNDLNVTDDSNSDEPICPHSKGPCANYPSEYPQYCDGCRSVR